MTLAIANHQIAKQAIPETFAADDGRSADELSSVEGTELCGAVNPADVSEVCTIQRGHPGRHRHRSPTAAKSDEMVNP